MSSSYIDNLDDDPWKYDILYANVTTELMEYYNTMKAPSISSFLTDYDIDSLNSIITSRALSGNIDKRVSLMNSILIPKGFKRIAGGTNRYAYINQNYPSIVFKIAIDSMGAKDSPREFVNQFKLRPYCTKVFEVSKYGIIGTFERVNQIRNSVEFFSVAKEIFSVCKSFISRDLILEDFGAKFFLNWGIRRGNGPVILDFPYVYTVDYSKLKCNKEINGRRCGGIIDYDEGLNFLHCAKCGRMYRAREIMKETEDDIFNQSTVAYSRKGSSRMKVSVMKGDTVIKEVSTPNVTTTISRIDYSKKKPRSGDLVVALYKGDKCIIRAKNGELVDNNISNNSLKTRKTTTSGNGHHSMMKRQKSGSYVERKKVNNEKEEVVQQSDSVPQDDINGKIEISKSDIIDMINDVKKEVKLLSNCGNYIDDLDFPKENTYQDELKLVRKRKDKKTFYNSTNNEEG